MNVGEIMNHTSLLKSEGQERMVGLERRKREADDAVAATLVVTLLHILHLLFPCGQTSIFASLRWLFSSSTLSCRTMKVLLFGEPQHLKLGEIFKVAGKFVALNLMACDVDTSLET